MLDPSHVFLSQGKGTIVGIFEPTNRDDKDSLSVGEHYLVWCTVDMQEYRCSFGDSVLQSEVLRGLPWRWVGERSVRHLSRALTKFIKLELKLEDFEVKRQGMLRDKRGRDMSQMGAGNGTPKKRQKKKQASQHASAQMQQSKRMSARKGRGPKRRRCSRKGCSRSSDLEEDQDNPGRWYCQQCWLELEEEQEEEEENAEEEEEQEEEEEEQQEEQEEEEQEQEKEEEEEEEWEEE